MTSVTSVVGPTSVRHCPTCREEQLFEQPPCEDGHRDCPEWVCVACGFALLVGVPDGGGVSGGVHAAA